jgi:hypothetical protein
MSLTSEDEDHLRLLSIFHYVVAGMHAVCAVLMALGATLAACIAVAGRFLSQRRRYLFCLVMACVMAALSMPFGTVLGVFTIIVLMRPTVKAAFGYPASR